MGRQAIGRRRSASIRLSHWQLPSSRSELQPCSGSGLRRLWTALVLGSTALPYRAGLKRVHDALAWLSQIGLFLMLGLLVFPSSLPAVAGVGLGAALFLGFVARPLAVAACLLPLRFPLRQIGYIGWIGLRGAVPIILGAFPVLAGVPGGERVFNIVFFIVVVSRRAHDSA